MPVPTTVSPSYLLRAATADDLAGIAELESLSYVIEGAWSLEDYQDDFYEPQRCYVVAEHDEALAGYGVAVLEDTDDERTLRVIAVTSAPTQRGRGLGRMLLNHMNAWGRDNGATWCELEVRTGNEVAINLYRSMGYETLDELVDFYDDGVDALAMRLVFPTS